MPTSKQPSGMRNGLGCLACRVCQAVLMARNRMPTSRIQGPERRELLGDPLGRRHTPELSRLQLPGEQMIPLTCRTRRTRSHGGDYTDADIGPLAPHAQSNHHLNVRYCEASSSTFPRSLHLPVAVTESSLSAGFRRPPVRSPEPRGAGDPSRSRRGWPPVRR